MPCYSCVAEDAFDRLYPGGFDPDPWEWLEDMFVIDSQTKDGIRNRTYLKRLLVLVFVDFCGIPIIAVVVCEADVLECVWIKLRM